MIRICLLFIGFILICDLSAQVGINSDSSQPDPSAMLDVSSTSHGILVPRMSAAKRDLISQPASGLMIFCTDNNQFYFNKGTPAVPNWILVNSQWINSGNNIYFNSGNVGLGIVSPINRLDVSGGMTIGTYAGSKTAPTNGLLVEGQVGIGTPTPVASAALEVSSASRGLLPPRMTKTQRDAIVNPATGLLIFCTDCSNSGNLQLFYAGKWHSQKFNSYPVVINVTQAGIAGLNHLLTGSYSYTDDDNDIQGTSVFNWFRADNSSGLNEIQIIGANLTTYTLVPADTTKYIRFSVIPVALTGDSPGDRVKASSYIGPIAGGCGLTLTDPRDGKNYGTILIGTQCWMKENLNVGIKINGTGNQTNNSIIEKYCYNDLEINCTSYGGIYQWDEMMNYTTSSNSNPSGRQGICPPGWHIPSDNEWCQLSTWLDAATNCNVTGVSSYSASGKMKQTGTITWADPNTGATNSSDFTALPAGLRNDPGNFLDLTGYTYFWSSTENAANGYYRTLEYNSANLSRWNHHKAYGFSVRCVKN